MRLGCHRQQAQLPPGSDLTQSKTLKSFFDRDNDDSDDDNNDVVDDDDDDDDDVNDAEKLLRHGPLVTPE